MKQRALNGLGVTLLALPEPFTIIPGIFIILTSIMMSRRSIDYRPRIEKLLRQYPEFYHPFSYRRPVRSKMGESVGWLKQQNLAPGSTHRNYTRPHPVELEARRRYIGEAPRFSG